VLFGFVILMGTTNTACFFGVPVSVGLLLAASSIAVFWSFSCYFRLGVVRHGYAYIVRFATTMYILASLISTRLRVVSIVGVSYICGTVCFFQFFPQVGLLLAFTRRE